MILGVLITLAMALNSTLHQQDVAIKMNSAAILAIAENAPGLSAETFNDKMEVERSRMKELVTTAVKEIAPSEVEIQKTFQSIRKGDDDHAHHTTRITSMERRLETVERKVFAE